MTDTVFRWWYDLDYDREKLELILRIRKCIMPELEKKTSAALAEPKSWINHIIESQGAESYVCDFSERFGFGGVFTKGKETEDFVEFRLAVPDAKGERYLGIIPEGKEVFLNISASLNFILRILCYPERYPETGEYQLLKVLCATQVGRIHGGSPGGWVGIGMADWMMEMGETVLAECTDAMLEAAQFVRRRRNYALWEFPAYVRDGGFTIDCPGDACGIFPDGSHKKGEGYEFTCHNTDSAFQQLLLIIGLAVLCAKARREMKKPLS